MIFVVVATVPRQAYGNRKGAIRCNSEWVIGRRCGDNGADGFGFALERKVLVSVHAWAGPMSRVGDRQPADPGHQVARSRTELGSRESCVVNTQMEELRSSRIGFGLRWLKILVGSGHTKQGTERCAVHSQRGDCWGRVRAPLEGTTAGSGARGRLAKTRPPLASENSRDTVFACESSIGKDFLNDFDVVGLQSVFGTCSKLKCILFVGDLRVVLLIDRFKRGAQESMRGTEKASFTARR
jgi:hypothetical protein